MYLTISGGKKTPQYTKYEALSGMVFKRNSLAFQQYAIVIVTVTVICYSDH